MSKMTYRWYKSLSYFAKKLHTHIHLQTQTYTHTHTHANIHTHRHNLQNLRLITNLKQKFSVLKGWKITAYKINKRMTTPIRCESPKNILTDYQDQPNYFDDKFQSLCYVKENHFFSHSNILFHPLGMYNTYINVEFHYKSAVYLHWEPRNIPVYISQCEMLEYLLFLYKKNFQNILSYYELC